MILTRKGFEISVSDDITESGFIEKFVERCACEIDLNEFKLLLEENGNLYHQVNKFKILSDTYIEHNNELESRIDNAIKHIESNYLKYQNRLDYKQHYQEYLDDVHKLLDILKGGK